MKITRMEMGLLKMQAETKAESRAICGISDMIFKWMPASVANNHGFRNVGNNYLNWCLVPDGEFDVSGEYVKSGLDAECKKWAKLHWSYVFKHRQ